MSLRPDSTAPPTARWLCEVCGKPTDGSGGDGGTLIPGDPVECLCHRCRGCRELVQFCKCTRHRYGWASEDFGGEEDDYEFPDPTAAEVWETEHFGGGVGGG